MPQAPRPHPGTLPPLLITCALGIERLALRGGPGPGPAGGGVTVLRTGMGPRAAQRAVTRTLDPAAAPGPVPDVVATGFCAGLDPGMRPGDLVVAAETRDAVGATPCTGGDVLAEALSGVARARPGGTVHTGPLACSDHVVRGAERAALRATGALAVDMESAVVLRTAVAAGARRVAAVRVVVDAPEHELIRIGTLRGGISAFRVLRAVLPALVHWHRSLPLPRR
ncbi:1-hydroxy-2-methyl-2-butenyl 4-diphosphate reductase [Streptomyces sp. B1866]|uniref:phosphorylase family protein n=1 Tax=Streptomyces sp. B1866 TaxID=3075431 RepID=UPI00289121BC|nr:1-hydroxy-2-methyl-2-butenyl 4-diphosphate reductase [Streptomyces sp. B1866]MDT3395863.1 1-hydroxy-2-methyl-2-butenyl 4-diphosphate reductase [Streptomyces sp. B1866]